MPEGHSIHRLAHQFTELFSGKVVAVTSPQGRFSDGARLLDGQTITGAYAHGKHLFICFDHDLTLNVHLGIYGAWTFGGEHFIGSTAIGAPRKAQEIEQTGQRLVATAPAEVAPTTRARIIADTCWADLVGAMTCRVLTPEQVANVRAELGQDPLSQDSSVETFYGSLKRTSRPIAVVLMDQKIISGVGNIFRAESLFRQGIDPMRPARDLSLDEALLLWEDLSDLLRVGVRLGKIVTTRDEHRAGIPLEDAWPNAAYYVYQRQGQNCLLCSSSIAMKELAGRKLYWCPQCQCSLAV
ncbi:Fpg/Nei family DNA glycosylase [Rothia sp. CCM 9418]|uniref:Fpg/Nei family DNA glycosylase n=1 Tax=Rothia sp. CCM 9418 TaxID=3402661 RepID=UPI003AE51A05